MSFIELKLCVCVCVCVCVLAAQLCPTLWDPMDWATRPFCPWDFPGKNSRVGSHSFFQGIFPIQGLNPVQADSLPSEPPGGLGSALGQATRSDTLQLKESNK